MDQRALYEAVRAQRGTVAPTPASLPDPAWLERAVLDMVAGRTRSEAHQALAGMVQAKWSGAWYGPALDVLERLLREQPGLFLKDPEQDAVPKGKLKFSQASKRRIMSKVRARMWDQRPSTHGFVQAHSAAIIQDWQVKSGAARFASQLWLHWCKHKSARVDQDWVEWPTHAVVRQMGYSRRAVQYWRRDLVLAGYIRHRVDERNRVFYNISRLRPPPFKSERRDPPDHTEKPERHEGHSRHSAATKEEHRQARGRRQSYPQDRKPLNKHEKPRREGVQSGAPYQVQKNLKKNLKEKPTPQTLPVKMAQEGQARERNRLGSSPEPFGRRPVLTTRKSLEGSVALPEEVLLE